MHSLGLELTKKLTYARLEDIITSDTPPGRHMSNYCTGAHNLVLNTQNRDFVEFHKCLIELSKTRSIRAI